jgi:hypothetical protein
MTFVRIAFVALAVLLPTVWTIAKAQDEPPAGETKPKSSKSKSKGKKKKGEEGGDTEKKPESDTGK